MNAAAKPWPNPLHGLQDAIRERAEEIYIRSGKLPGRDLDNWAQAEQEILREAAAPTVLKAIVVKVEGTQYIGRYDLESSDDYIPGEFGNGAAVPVRFQDNKMFVKRPNGKILETVIVKKINCEDSGADSHSSIVSVWPT
jgi:hypothetical protein